MNFKGLLFIEVVLLSLLCDVSSMPAVEPAANTIPRQETDALLHLSLSTIMIDERKTPPESLRIECVVRVSPQSTHLHTNPFSISISRSLVTTLFEWSTASPSTVKLDPSIKERAENASCDKVEGGGAHDWKCVLPLSHVFYNESGSYRCVLRSANIEGIKSNPESINLDVNVSPKQTTKPIIERAGRTASLRCGCDGRPAPALFPYMQSLSDRTKYELARELEQVDERLLPGKEDIVTVERVYSVPLSLQLLDRKFTCGCRNNAKSVILDTPVALTFDVPLKIPAMFMLDASSESIVTEFSEFGEGEVTVRKDNKFACVAPVWPKTTLSYTLNVGNNLSEGEPWSLKRWQQFTGAKRALPVEACPTSAGPGPTTCYILCTVRQPDTKAANTLHCSLTLKNIEADNSSTWKYNCIPKNDHLPLPPLTTASNPTTSSTTTSTTPMTSTTSMPTPPIGATSEHSTSSGPTSTASTSTPSPIVPEESSRGLPWWAWLLISLGGLALVLVLAGGAYYAWFWYSNQRFDENRSVLRSHQMGSAASVANYSSRPAATAAGEQPPTRYANDSM